MISKLNDTRLAPSPSRTDYNCADSVLYGLDFSFWAVSYLGEFVNGPSRSATRFYYLI